MHLFPINGRTICLYFFGILFLTIGLIGVFYWPSLAEHILDKALVLFENGPTFNKWSETPIPIYTHIYLFNWTNPEQIHEPDIMPNFVRMGPYVFQERDRKVDITWNTNPTVTFKQQRTWYFEPDMSKGSLEDHITAPHLPTLAATENSNIITSLILNNILNEHGGSLYQTHTVREWLFEGFHDELLTYIKNNLIPNVPSEYFAWLLDRNNSKEFEGNFTINTGQDNIEKVGELQLWNNASATPFFDGDCAKINGSTGDMFGPRITMNNTLTLFIKDACRPINLVAVNHTEIEGINAIRFETQPDSFDSGAINPKMKCFCKKNNCPKSGVTDLGPCTMGAPVILSHVNFKYADSFYSNTTTVHSTSDPNEDIFFITVEPRLGIPLEANLAFQISIRIRPKKKINILEGVPEFYAPALVLNNKVRVSLDLANEIKFGLSVPKIGYYAGIASLILGIILFALGIYLSAKRR